ncbi:hypothetical protein OESDEN_13252, partial [Oesophagostomum dentatum]
ISTSQSISIDNEIVGDPDIECLDEEIRIWVKTRKPFAGRIYAKGKADNEECYKDDFARERTQKPHFDLRFGICGMRSLRSVSTYTEPLCNPSMVYLLTCYFFPSIFRDTLP